MNNNNNINNINKIHNNFNITNGENIKKVFMNSANKLNKVTSNSREYVYGKMKDLSFMIRNSTSNISWVIIGILFFYVFML